jgi:carbonic anhydrase
MRLVRVMVAVSFLTVVGAAAAKDEAVHWGYGEHGGPAKWGELKPEFATCKTGKNQSPIDIKGAVAADLDPIAFDYKPAPLHIIDNGHSIQVNYPPGSTITVGGKSYELYQFHFHRPSEEKINGKAARMVVHLVHRDPQGNLAVVAVLLTNGKENPLVATLWSNLPKVKEKEVAVDGVTIDPAGFLPQDRSYYTFTGSLTTPPCTEGVAWYVLKMPTEVSRAQIDRFAKIYRNNARPVQPLNDRPIKMSK